MSRAPNLSPGSPTVAPPILLDDAQGAAVYGVGLRTFLELQTQPWFPKPRVLGPRLKRHVYAELMAAVENMPRQQERSEPAQLLRGRIERMKRDGMPA